MKKGSNNNIETDPSEHNIKYFAIGIIIGFILVLISIFMGNNDNLMAVGIIVMGITITFFPFCTPDTIRLVGYRKSQKIGRVLGIILIIVGLWIKIS